MSKAVLTPQQRGAKILAFLESIGETKSSAARKADVTFKTMDRICRGASKDLKVTTVERFVRRLGVPRDLLTPETPE
jgi:hypothetical protein